MLNHSKLLKMRISTKLNKNTELPTIPRNFELKKNFFYFETKQKQLCFN